MYNLFLDDMRVPMDCFEYTHQPVYLTEDWVVVTNYEEFVMVITERGLPEIISFDHDLSYEDIENWRDINGYEGIYQVSSHGRIARVKKSRGTKNLILKPSKNKSGLYITLRNKGDDCRKKFIG